MNIDLKAIRERDALVQQPTTSFELAAEQGGAIVFAVRDRHQLLAAVDAQSKLLRRAIMDRVCFGQHADDSSECEWCLEARALLRDLDGDARGGGR